jgi:probable rRNA maturation factor
MLIDIEVEDERWLGAHISIQAHLLKVLSHVLTEEGANPNGDVSILLCNDQTMRELNAEHRQKDKATNVLAFPSASMPFPDGGHHYGDVALGYETCLREAAEQGKSIEAHLTHLALHGVLHLLGYDHIVDDDANKMEEREIYFLHQFGYADPYNLIGAQ